MHVFKFPLEKKKLWKGLSGIICVFPDFECTFSQNKIQLLERFGVAFTGRVDFSVMDALV